jgi:transcriptional regulator with XRE-family HTH domain
MTATLHVRAWREHRDLSQEEAARRAGIRQATWSRLERGITEPHRLTLAAVAQVLEVQVADLRRTPAALARAQRRARIRRAR